MLTMDHLSRFPRTMPRKVVSGPDYDDDYADYEDYEDDYDDYDETGYADVKPPVKEKGTRPSVQATSLSAYRIHCISYK